jgi:hypothetical protein
MIGGSAGHFLHKFDHRLPSVAIGTGIIFSCLPIWFVMNMNYDNNTHMLKAPIALFSAGVLTILSLPIE